ncbi:MAG: 1-acyl-sn-glycerol-3-phosphate acyltransferase [Planctomycetes bacterium]|nr:1-acyl-sn-glycerol-3-phosphate acyltransferase [Planctomycetota bacterium]
MVRALLTLLVSALGVLLFGGPCLLVDCVWPTRRLVALVSFLWARTTVAAAGVRLRIENRPSQHARIPRFYVGNHQSALDIPLMIAALDGHVRFMAKDSLFRIPFFGWQIARFGYVPVDRKNPRAASEQLTAMLDGLGAQPVSMVVFPEGTRSTDGRLLPFRRGAMKICARAGLDVVPFSIDGAYRVLRRGELAVRPGVVRIRFAQPIPADEVRAMSATELEERVQSAVAEGLAGREGAAERPAGRPATASAG